MGPHWDPGLPPWGTHTPLSLGPSVRPTGSQWPPGYNRNGLNGPHEAFFWDPIWGGVINYAAPPSEVGRNNAYTLFINILYNSKKVPPLCDFSFSRQFLAICVQISSESNYLKWVGPGTQGKRRFSEGSQILAAHRNFISCDAKGRRTSAFLRLHLLVFKSPGLTLGPKGKPFLIKNCAGM